MLFHKHGQVRFIQGTSMFQILLTTMVLRYVHWSTTNTLADMHCQPDKRTHYYCLLVRPNTHGSAIQDTTALDENGEYCGCAWTTIQVSYHDIYCRCCIKLAHITTLLLSWTTRFTPQQEDIDIHTHILLSCTSILIHLNNWHLWFCSLVIIWHPLSIGPD
jgi:hypothetical protein